MPTMEETSAIPPPTALISQPVAQPTNPTPPSIGSSPRRKPATAKKSSSTSRTAAGAAKPKQSKSRNGCITCKAKRLKCDETKPSCQQCHKRSVTCGGYKKDFKWRPFEEATFVNKIPPNRPKQNPMSQHNPPVPGLSQSPSISDASMSPVGDGEGDVAIQETQFSSAMPSSSKTQIPLATFPNHHIQSPMVFDMSASPHVSDRVVARPFEANSVTSPLDSLFEDSNLHNTSTTRLSTSGQSPRLIDLLLPGSELNARPQSQRPVGMKLLPESSLAFKTGYSANGLVDDDVEEIIRDPQHSYPQHWSHQDHSQSYSASSTRIQSPSTTTRSQSPASTRSIQNNRLFRQPEVLAGSPEMLMLRFDKQTCGILSVKDGPTENPWRTLIWPLARNSPALYHAIASMTAFHTAKEKPALRVDGMEHMRSSIRSLATGLGRMRTDTALATTLALAFSESWDQHISTGIEHLRGARILVNQALVKHSTNPLQGDDLARLKFLCNTWIYMDVIARLTSVDDDDMTDFDKVLLPLRGPLGTQMTEVDPLMGCATELFPLVGRAANLCRKVRAARTTSIAIISQANELKELIERWQPASEYEQPEDPSAEIQHAIQTAESYRYATLLYLHQAVPEIPSMTSAELAKKVLIYLATVPLSSRLVIVQIYPLLAAGCEAFEAEDRQWVEDRWLSMSLRMWIGNIDKCLVVTKEVWARRDEAEAAREAARITQRRPAMMHSELSKRKFEEEQFGDMFSFSEMLNGSGHNGSKRPRTDFTTPHSGPAHGRKKSMDYALEDLDLEMTVRGAHHWVGVMKDWGWEILLG